MENIEVSKALKKIAPNIHRTPIHTSSWLNSQLDAAVFFKCENFQRMGAFKIRGALHAIHHLTDKQKENGVVTHSSGNFAQALALASKSLSIPCYVVMPSNAPQVKQNAVLDYGAEIILCEPTNQAREKTAESVSQKTGATFIHPSNDLNVIIGQGTATFELIEDIEDLDAIMVPVGGGGLIAGAVLANKELGNKVEIIGAEPFEVDDAYQSLKANKIQFNKTINTVADGLKTHLGDINFPIIKDDVSKIIRVEENEIIDAMRILWERLKLVVEPSAAVALAAVIKNKKEFRKKRIGVLLSGGNIDLSKIGELFVEK